jgi:hypothetical protein
MPRLNTGQPKAIKNLSLSLAKKPAFRRNPSPLGGLP